MTVSGKLGNVSCEASGKLSVNHFSTVLLSTDKPLYQPGQPLHMRLMAFDPDHKTVANQAVHIEIRDPDDTLVFRTSPQTTRFGVASADWQIPENLRLGDYQVHAAIVDDSDRHRDANATVKISRYDLPTFSVGVKPDRAYYLEGQNAEIEVRANYLFGEAVHLGHVRVAQETERKWNFREQKWEIEEAASYEGETDDQGHYTAHVDLSSEHDDLSANDYERYRDITFAAYYTDSSTGRTEQRRFDIRITKELIHIYLMQPNYSQPEGLPIEFYISTDYADGTPAACEVEIRWTTSDVHNNPGAPLVEQLLRRVRTNRYGVAKVSGLNLPRQSVDRDFYLSLRAKDRKGLVGNHTESDWNMDHPGVRVATDKTLYAANDPVYAELATSEKDIRLVVDAVHDSQVLASQVVHVGRAHASVFFPPSEKFQNEVTIVAYALGARYDYPHGNVAGTRTIYFPKNHELNIEIQSSKSSYGPGEEVSATLHVTGPEGAQTENALGLLVVDMAVEERARTDRDFGGNAGFFHFRGDEWSGDRELNGVRRSALDKLDLSKPLPEGFEVAADALLQARDAYANIFSSDSRGGDLRRMFASEIDPVLNPLRDVLNTRYQQLAEYLKTEATLRSELAASGISMDNLLDPWGMPYRTHFSVSNEMDVLEITSAGPDKSFDTEDDFRALKMEWPYFKPNANAIQKAVDGYHVRTGNYIRDVEALKNEVARAGIDLSSLADPWRRAYRYEFGVRETRFTVTVRSAGPDGRCGTEAVPSHDDFILSTAAIDYFSDINAKMDAALSKVFKDTHAFPENTDQLTQGLQNSGISWDSLRDAWGHPYYAVFHQDAVYADRINVETYENHVGKAGQHVELVPVTRQMNYVYIRSAGEDGIEGTSDDFYVATFARNSFERTGQDQDRVSIPNPVILSGATGAIARAVMDASGAAIPGTEVSAKNIGSGQTFKIKSEDSGNYTLRNLPAGMYTVEFIALGFRDGAITGVPVRSSSVTNLDATLEVGTQTQAITVFVQAEQVNTSVSNLAAMVPEGKPGSLPQQAMTAWTHIDGWSDAIVEYVRALEQTQKQ